MPDPAAGDSTLKSGDLVLLDYELWAEGGERSELVDTTRDEVARKAEAKLPEGITLEPKPHLIGGEYFPGGIEQALVGAKLGETLKKEFGPAEAFGERDPKLIELFSQNEIARLPEMRRDDAELNLGTVLTIRGRRGRVVTLTAGRVRVDFNPELAGRKIRAEFRPISRIEAPVEQARALVELTYGRGKEFDIAFKDGVVTLKVPDRTKFDFAWTGAKPRLIDQLRTRLKPKSVQIVEEYVTPAAKSGATESDEAPAAKSPKPHAHKAKAAAEPATEKGA